MGWGGADGLGAPSDSLLQMDSQGQRVLGFHLSRVFSLTRQPELGARVGWSPAGLMFMVKWGLSGEEEGVKTGELGEMDRGLCRRNSLEYFSAD